MFQWYMDRHHAVLDVLHTGNQVMHLAAFVDYDILVTSTQQLSDNQPLVVIINIDNTYFINYNRAKKFNIDTEHQKDQVTIIQPVEGGTNSLMGLTPGSGDIYEVVNYKNSGRRLVIEACRTKTSDTSSIPSISRNRHNSGDDMTVDIAIVSIAMDQSECANIIMDEMAQQQQPDKLPMTLPPPQVSHNQSTVIVNLSNTVTSSTTDHTPYRFPFDTYHPSSSPFDTTGRPISAQPSLNPTSWPSHRAQPLIVPSNQPSRHTTKIPTQLPTSTSMFPTHVPTMSPTATRFPPTRSPITSRPTYHPTKPPTFRPTIDPTLAPSPKKQANKIPNSATNQNKDEFITKLMDMISRDENNQKAIEVVGSARSNRTKVSSP
jgi:hypothetical protein